MRDVRARGRPLLRATSSAQQRGGTSVRRAGDEAGKSEEAQAVVAMDFSVKDGKRLWSLVRRQEALADKKRRWLESMIHAPDSCCSRRLKRPKFLADA
jgi:hypothetical protein